MNVQIMIAFMAIVLFSFQNCSEVEFAATKESKQSEKVFVLESDCGDEVCNEVPVEQPPEEVGETPEPPDEEVVDNPEEPTDKEKKPKGICGAGKIEDVILNVKHVEVDNAIVESLTGELSLNAISKGLELTADTNLSGNQVRLVLEAQGNYVQDVSGALFPLKTPSQQQSGLKVLVKRANLKAGLLSTLTFDINYDKQIVINPVKCILKPVIHKGVLE